MSTPISELPDVEESSSQSVVNPITTLTVSKWQQWLQVHPKDILILFIAVIVAFQIPLGTVRYRLPQQLFVMGDLPLRAALVVGVYVVIKFVFR